MTLILNAQEVRLAIVEYLVKRGLEPVGEVRLNTYKNGDWTLLTQNLQATVNLNTPEPKPPGEGPYR
jgi:hypothetical protein